MNACCVRSETKSPENKENCNVNIHSIKKVMHSLDERTAELLTLFILSFYLTSIAILDLNQFHIRIS